MSIERLRRPNNRVGGPAADLLAHLKQRDFVGSVPQLAELICASEYTAYLAIYNLERRGFAKARSTERGPIRVWITKLGRRAQCF